MVHFLRDRRSGSAWAAVTSALTARWAPSSARRPLPARTPASESAGAFSVAGLGITQPGNAGRNIIRGPGLINFDVSLFKNVRLPNERELQFRVRDKRLVPLG